MADRVFPKLGMKQSRTYKKGAKYVPNTLKERKMGKLPLQTGTNAGVE